ncbi:MAG: formylglycine-generating enzyme family protein, partial [Kiritimatiellaceae bacterium]|nr:formylglycine-generating enzyme family protein [Kiritimatiellaceae bacterium]
ETYVAPEPMPKINEEDIPITDWPFTAEKAKSMQKTASSSSLDLGNGVSLQLTKVPAGEFIMGSTDGAIDEQPRAKVKIDKPFWMGTMEVSLAQYLQFNPKHRNRVYDMHYKDQVNPGYDMDKPELPAIRMSWNEAIEFCEWLSKKSGLNVTLPTEAQWEWACRAGTESSLNYGTLDSDFSKYANLADASISKLAVSGVNPQPVKNPNKYWDFELKDARFNDQTLHLAPIKSYAPNAWGLLNMHGNVSEWTRSAYKPYPYRSTDGKNNISKEDKRVVRGGSWYDRPKRATSSFRLSYPQWQRVFNVGFRIVVEDVSVSSQQAKNK